MGDRNIISAMTISGGQNNIEMLAAGPKDPACCPSQKLKLSYVLSKGKRFKSVLVNTEQSVVASHSNTKIAGIVWKLKRIDDTSRLDNFAIADPNNYTLVLGLNGPKPIVIGCMAHTPSPPHQDRSRSGTLAECAPGSRYAEYLRYLAEAVSFEVNEKHLQLNLKMNKGQLVFENGGAVFDNPKPIQ